MIKRTLMAIALMALCVCASAGQLVSGKPLPSSTSQYDLSVNSSGQHSPAHMAGERTADSPTGTDYTTTAGEWAVKSIAYNGDLTARTIYNGPCLIAGIEVTTAMSAHASNLQSGGVTVYPIPASRTAGMYPFPGPAIFETDCVWAPGSLSAGAINVWYRPLGAESTWAP